MKLETAEIAGRLGLMDQTEHPVQRDNPGPKDPLADPDQVVNQDQKVTEEFEVQKATRDQLASQVARDPMETMEKTEIQGIPVLLVDEGLSALREPKENLELPEKTVWMDQMDPQVSV